MTGSDTGMAGLYTGEADIALLGRVATDSELQAFEWVFRRPPACTEIAARGIDTPGKTPASALSMSISTPGRARSPRRRHSSTTF